MIDKRNKTLDSVEKFDSHFVLFSRKELRDAVDRVERTLGEGDDGIAILYNDPHRYTNDEYLVYVTFTNHKPKEGMTNRAAHISTGMQAFGARLGTRNNAPTIKFEGFSFNGDVRVSFNPFGFETNSFSEKEIIPAIELNADRCFKILVDFLEVLYT